MKESQPHVTTGSARDRLEGMHACVAQCDCSTVYLPLSHTHTYAGLQLKTDLESKRHTRLTICIRLRMFPLSRFDIITAAQHSSSITVIHLAMFATYVRHWGSLGWVLSIETTIVSFSSMGWRPCHTLSFSFVDLLPGFASSHVVAVTLQGVAGAAKARHQASGYHDPQSL